MLKGAYSSCMNPFEGLTILINSTRDGELGKVEVVTFLLKTHQACKKS